VEKIKILTVVGARPQFIKAAAISREIRRSFRGRLHEVILHTGQHYDENMSEVFFNQLEIPAPDYNLNVGSASHGEQTALMIKGIEDVIIKEKPDVVILYGDTNSTLAGAVAASKLHIPVAHIEAGLRSFNKSMPEEINRIVCDHVSTWLFVPTIAGINNLEREGFDVSHILSRYNNGETTESNERNDPREDTGKCSKMNAGQYSKMNTGQYSKMSIGQNAGDSHYHCTIDNPGVYHTGDIMYDNSLFFSGLADRLYPVDKLLREKVGFVPERFVLATIHRDSNTDDRERINSIFRALADIAEDGVKEGVTVIVPLHPRTSKILKGMLEPDLYSRLKVNIGNEGNIGNVSRLDKGDNFGNEGKGGNIGNEGKGNMGDVSKVGNRVILLEPLSFMEMISLEKAAEIIITDSGGVQKEAFFFRKPSLILRPQTEWVEIVECGAALLTDASYQRITEGYRDLSAKALAGELKFPALFGDGRAAASILEIISASLG